MGPMGSLKPGSGIWCHRRLVTVSLPLGGTPREVALPNCQRQGRLYILTTAPQRPFPESVGLCPQEIMFIFFSPFPQPVFQGPSSGD